jgi:hypothetical protein
MSEVARQAEPFPENTSERFGGSIRLPENMSEGFDALRLLPARTA